VQTAASQLVAQLDAVDRAPEVRTETLDGVRTIVTVLGVAIALLAASLSLWLVRRYALTLGRDAARRTNADAERIAIVASVRRLRTQATPEATTELIAEALVLRS